ncbi:hypothetical protein ACJX0J_021799 [Zea mays]
MYHPMQLGLLGSFLICYYYILEQRQKVQYHYYRDYEGDQCNQQMELNRAHAKAPIKLDVEAHAHIQKHRSMPTLFLSTTSQYVGLNVNRLHFPAIILFVMQNWAGFALLLGLDLYT